jgi:hypothetical protein
MVFEDLTNPDTKKLAYRTLKPFSGIYLVVNLVNEKYYIGSAAASLKTIRRALSSNGVIKRKYLVTDTIDT